MSDMETRIGALERRLAEAERLLSRAILRAEDYVPGCKLGLLDAYFEACASVADDLPLANATRRFSTT
jgi:hypothetical protein